MLATESQPFRNLVIDPKNCIWVATLNSSRQKVSQPEQYCASSIFRDINSWPGTGSKKIFATKFSHLSKAIMKNLEFKVRKNKNKFKYRDWIATISQLSCGPQQFYLTRNFWLLTTKSATTRKISRIVKTGGHSGN